MKEIEEDIHKCKIFQAYGVINIFLMSYGDPVQGMWDVQDQSESRNPNQSVLDVQGQG